jgi:hypothetical protein
MIRAKLCLAAIVANQYNPDIMVQKERLLKKGKNKMQALGAAVRELVHQCFGVLTEASNRVLARKPPKTGLQAYGRDGIYGTGRRMLATFIPACLIAGPALRDRAAMLPAAGRAQRASWRRLFAAPLSG